MTDQETLAALAASYPGIIRTLRVLEGELRDASNLPPEVLRELGMLLQRIGQAVIDHGEQRAPDVIDAQASVHGNNSSNTYRE